MTPQELKNSILQLAIQGKLVEQRPEEGTAEELYQQIQEEKQRLIKAGKIKKEKPLPEITEDEKPFDIPESWLLVRLNELVRKTIKRGKSPTYVAESNILVFAQKCNAKTGRINMDLAQYLDESKFNKYPTEEYMEDGDIIVNSTGNGTLGRIGIFYSSDNPSGKIIVPDSHVTVIRTNKLILTEYIFYFLKYYQPYLESLGEGSTNQTELRPDVLKNLVVGLPPLAEQERIVTKIEKLLPYIDRYEQAWGRLEDFNKRFPDDMKKSILQLAIQGKLVEQRPGEGTAEELYQQIQAEKLRLIRAGKIKKERPLSEITEDEEPFDIPENWKWVRLGEITQFQGGYAFKSSTYVPLSNNQVIRLGNVKPNTLLLDEKQVFIPDDIASATIDYKLKENDILVTMTGTRKKRDYFFTLAVSAKDLASRNLFLNQRVGCLRIYGLINIKYLLCVLQNEHIKDLIFAKETGTANQGNIGSEDMKCSILVPLPPLAEQKRIVTKLEEILPLCEKLI